MKPSNPRKRIYMILGLITLNCTVVSFCYGFGTTVDCFGNCEYNILYDPVLWQIGSLVVGIPLFLLFVVLERRAAKQINDK
jgi:hypothetical protein